MRAWHHCMAETHDKPLCDAGAAVELKWLAMFLILLPLVGCVLWLRDLRAGAKMRDNTLAVVLVGVPAVIVLGAAAMVGLAYALAMLFTLLHLSPASS
jgi:hypothetical protein